MPEIIAEYASGNKVILLPDAENAIPLEYRTAIEIAKRDTRGKLRGVVPAFAYFPKAVDYKNFGPEKPSRAFFDLAYMIAFLSSFLSYEKFGDAQNHKVLTHEIVHANTIGSRDGFVNIGFCKTPLQSAQQRPIPQGNYTARLEYSPKQADSCVFPFDSAQLELTEAYTDFVADLVTSDAVTIVFGDIEVLNKELNAFLLRAGISNLPLLLTRAMAENDMDSVTAVLRRISSCAKRLRDKEIAACMSATLQPKNIMDGNTTYRSQTSYV